MNGRGLAVGDEDVLARLRPVETPVGSSADSRDDVMPKAYAEFICPADDCICD